MILAGNQPYFMPYIGYWQLLNAVDIFVVGDDFNFIKHGWITRNKILTQGEPGDFRIEVKGASSFKLINQIELNNIPVQKKMKTLSVSYCRTPYFNNGMQLMEKIFSYVNKNRNLADFLFYSISCVCNYLGITTKLMRSSSLENNADKKKEYRIYDMCERLGADHYYNAIGGKELYSYQDFKKHGIELGFLKMGDITYRQFGDKFIPNLSLIDVIMFNSKEEIREMLQNYTII